MKPAQVYDAPGESVGGVVMTSAWSNNEPL